MKRSLPHTRESVELLCDRQVTKVGALPVLEHRLGAVEGSGSAIADY